MATVVQGPFLGTQGFGTSATATLGGAVTSGNSIVAMLTVWSSATSISCTDSASNVYGSADASEVDSHNEATTYWFHLNNITNSPTTVTLSWTGGATAFVYVWEIDEALTFDASYDATGSSASPAVTFTTAAASSFACGVLGTSSGHTINSLSSGWNDEIPDGSYPEFQTGLWKASLSSGETLTVTPSASVQYYLLGAAYETSAATAYTLTAEQGTYTLTGSAAYADYAMGAASGTYSLSGQDATLDYNGVTHYTVTAEQGTYTLSGQAATKLSTYVLVGAQGSYTLQGFSVQGGTQPSQGTGASVVLKVNSCYVVSSTGRTRWVDYIPVKQVVAGSVGRWDNDSALEMEILSSVTGLVEWRDYVPVVEVADDDSGRWRYDNLGFIPIVGVE